MTGWRRLSRVVLLGGIVAALGSCVWREAPPRPPVMQGWVSEDRVRECLSGMMRAPMPVYYLMPLDEALAVLGEPHREQKELSVLRAFARTEGARAYAWYYHEATLYLVFSRRGKKVVNLIVVDDVTNMGQEVMLTREEILSAHIRPGMGVDRVYKIMGVPDRVEELRIGRDEEIDRFWYESGSEIASPVFIDIDRERLTVVSVSTAPEEETGPPPDLE